MARWFEIEKKREALEIGKEGAHLFRDGMYTVILKNQIKDIPK